MVTFHGRTSLSSSSPNLHLLPPSSSPSSSLSLFFPFLQPPTERQLMKIIKLVPLSQAVFPKGPAKPSNRESRRATGWFVNVQSGITFRARERRWSRLKNGAWSHGRDKKTGTRPIKWYEMFAKVILTFVTNRRMFQKCSKIPARFKYSKIILMHKKTNRTQLI